MNPNFINLDEDESGIKNDLLSLNKCYVIYFQKNVTLIFSYNNVKN